MENTTAKKVLNVVLSVLMYVFIAICIVGVVFAVSAKKESDGATTIFGTQMRFVLSNSMAKSENSVNVDDFEIKDIPVKSMVFIKVAPRGREEFNEWCKEQELKVGDVLTFKYVYVKQETITHRITYIEYIEEKGGYEIHLAGDNKNSESENLEQIIYTYEIGSPNYVVGQVVGQSYILGCFVNILKSDLGLVLIVIVPALIIMILEVIKIVRTLGADKRKAELEEKQKQQDEIDLLKRKLAELESKNNGNGEQPQKEPQKEEGQTEEVKAEESANETPEDKD